MHWHWGFWIGMALCIVNGVYAGLQDYFGRNVIAGWRAYKRERERFRPWHEAQERLGRDGDLEAYWRACGADDERLFAIGVRSPRVIAAVAAGNSDYRSIAQDLLQGQSAR